MSAPLAREHPERRATPRFRFAAIVCSVYAAAAIGSRSRRSRRRRRRRRRIRSPARSLAVHTRLNTPCALLRRR